MLNDWFKKPAQLFHPIRSKQKPIVTPSYTFSRASRQLRASALSFDWFIGLPVFSVIGWSVYFGFGFRTLKLKTALSTGI